MKGRHISKADLAAAAKACLGRIGLSSGEIAALKARRQAASVCKAPNVPGTVTQIERYGPALTDIRIRRFDDLGFKFGDMATVVCDDGFVLEAPYLDGSYGLCGQAMKEAGVNAAVNLSDAADNMKTWLAAKDFVPPCHAGLSSRPKMSKTAAPEPSF